MSSLLARVVLKLVGTPRELATIVIIKRSATPCPTASPNPLEGVSVCSPPPSKGQMQW